MLQTQQETNLDLSAISYPGFQSKDITTVTSWLQTGGGWHCG